MAQQTKGQQSAVSKAVAVHPRLFDENLYVYPVLSRRSRGLSIGVNLNPDKICNFDCIYCQVDRAVPPVVRDVDLDRLLAELRLLLENATSGALFEREPFHDLPKELRRINDIAFSGDGEPTTCPAFPDVVAGTAQIKRELGLDDVKIVLLTNCTRFHRPAVQRALETMQAANGEVWAKLDAGTADYYDTVDRTKVSFDQVTRNLKAAALRWPLVIQSLFMRIREQPPPKDEIAAYCDLLQDVLDSGGGLKLIQAHTVARSPAETYVSALTNQELDDLGGVIQARLPNVPVEVFYGVNRT